MHFPLSTAIVKSYKFTCNIQYPKNLMVLLFNFRFHKNILYIEYFLSSSQNTFADILTPNEMLLVI